jgi:hypothetical protein
LYKNGAEGPRGGLQETRGQQLQVPVIQRAALCQKQNGGLNEIKCLTDGLLNEDKYA